MWLMREIGNVGGRGNDVGETELFPLGLTSPLPWPLRSLGEVIPKGSCRLKILVFNLFGVVRISNTQSAPVSPGSMFSSYGSWKYPIIGEN